jgi:hypothetical protein
MLGQLQAIHARHADIRNHHIGMLFGAGLERGEAVGGFGDDLVRQCGGKIRQQVTQARARRRFVIDYQDA